MSWRATEEVAFCVRSACTFFWFVAVVVASHESVRCVVAFTVVLRAEGVSPTPITRI